ncbi:hypothetical protein FQN60_012260 [Etheostoma spectabile]|uniref:Uncharacterized protein n=1 Tax=Etheostoma spectabile TaxID=54343 RepID=A0A5J5DP41_9PERO|nr:hypothetical protein FQN60_012260 [Etheostoma spectabile]
MELEQATEDCAQIQPTPTPPAQPKKPSQGLYVPKQRLHGSKEKAQTQGEVKPRPRPRYTDKAKKNAKNKKDKAGAADKEASVGGEDGGKTENGDPDVKDEQLQDTDVPVNGQPGSTNVKEDVTSWLEEASPQEAEGEEESWDTLFNDDGDCLEPHLLKELSLQEGRKKKSNQEPRFDYYNMDREDEDDIDLTEDELAHIVEIYDFPAEFKTEDLLKLFQCYQYLSPKYIKQHVDSREALRSRHPLMKLRPLSKSSSAIKAQARSCSDYLLPAKERPQTSAALARKLVIGALGIKSNQTKDQRESERKKLQEAREQKHLAAKQKEDAWEGK